MAVNQSHARIIEVMEDKVEEGETLKVKCQLGQTSISWKQELKRHQSRVETFHKKLKEVKASIQISSNQLSLCPKSFVKASIQSSENDTEKELELLWRRVRTTATLLTYLKSKARTIAVPHLSHTSCGIKHREGVGLIDRHDIPLSEWSKDVDLSSFGSSDDENLLAGSIELGALAGNDAAYIGDVLKSVHLVTDVMESLVKRVIMAETEVATEREKVKSGLEEIGRKTLKIKCMSEKVDEMENLALGANAVLNEMWEKFEEMVQETTRQRQRIAENEQELSRVKHDFESLRSHIDSLINVREALLSSEKQFQTMEKLFDRLIAKTSHLESEKEQKEREVQKLMGENVKLRALLDKKEAQLVALNEQCKFMALNNPGA